MLLSPNQGNFSSYFFFLFLPHCLLHFMWCLTYLHLVIRSGITVPHNPILLFFHYVYISSRFYSFALSLCLLSFTVRYMIQVEHAHPAPLIRSHPNSDMRTSPFEEEPNVEPSSLSKPSYTMLRAENNLKIYRINICLSLYKLVKSRVYNSLDLVFLDHF